MTIIKHVFCGNHAAPTGTLSPFEVTCRLVNSLNGCESMHITGWVAVNGIPASLSKIGIVSPGVSMLGQERGIVMTEIGEFVHAQLET